MGRGVLPLHDMEGRSVPIQPFDLVTYLMFH